MTKMNNEPRYTQFFAKFMHFWTITLPWAFCFYLVYMGELWGPMACGAIVLTVLATLIFWGMGTYDD